MYKVYLRRLLRRPMAVIGLMIVLLVVFAALLAPMIAAHPPNQQYQGFELKPPSFTFWIGTDHLGRDLFSRALYGTRLSLTVAGVALAISVAVGVVLGLLAGYLEGWVDAVIMRTMDAILAFPVMLAGVAIAAVLGPGAVNLAIAAGVVAIPGFARQVRASVLAERAKEYTEAARALGGSDARIMFKHILPNVVTPVIVQAVIGVAFAINLEAGLTFLGLGAEPPEASLGSTLNMARTYMRVAPWYSIFPGLLLAVMLIGLNFLALSVRDMLDPRHKDL